MPGISSAEGASPVDAAPGPWIPGLAIRERIRGWVESLFKRLGRVSVFSKVFGHPKVKQIVSDFKFSAKKDSPGSTGRTLGLLSMRFGRRPSTAFRNVTTACFEPAWITASFA